MLSPNVHREVGIGRSMHGESATSDTYLIEAWERMTFGGLRLTSRYIADTGEWIRDCLKWRGELLQGREAHWCYEWDGLPIDETCIEWPCCS